VLAYPDENGSFILDTYACDYGISGILTQVQNSEERVIAYASNTLTKSMHFLWGRKFKIRTDHGSIVWLKNFKDPEGMAARWISVLDTYNYEIEHRRGSLHKNADALSRVSIGHRKCKRTDCPDCVGTVLSISHNGMGSRRLDPKRLYQSVEGKVEKKPVCSGKMAKKGCRKT